MAEPDAHLALVALQLGEPEEAKKLFTSAGRPDLLNRLLQARPCTTSCQPAIPFCLPAYYCGCLYSVLAECNLHTHIGHGGACCNAVVVETLLPYCTAR